MARLLDELRLLPLRASGGNNLSEGCQRQQGFVGRWDVKFDRHTSVNDFLERVQELALSRGVSKTQLLRSAPELLMGDALLWYRTGEFIDWDDLALQLREAF